MAEEPRKIDEPTPAFFIAVLLGIIIFILIIREMPFTDDYTFINYVGILLLCGFVTGIIFGLSVGLISVIFKVIVEIIVALVLLADALIVAIYYSAFDQVLLFFKNDISVTATWLVILISLMGFLLFNLLCVTILFPFARIAKSAIFD